MFLNLMEIMTTKRKIMIKDMNINVFLDDIIILILFFYKKLKKRDEKEDGKEKENKD